MNKDEIVKHLKAGQTGTLCISRDKVNEDLNLIIKSLSMALSLKKGYELQVDFDAINQIEQGEGWQWCSSSMSLEQLIQILEEELKTPLSSWDYIPPAGILYVHDENIDWEQLRKQGLIFEDTYDYGFDFLPKLPEDVFWSRRPYPYDKEHGLLDDYGIE